MARKKVINLTPYIAVYILGALSSYIYFTVYDHIFTEHEFKRVDYIDVFLHIKEGCDEFGINSGE